MQTHIDQARENTNQPTVGTQVQQPSRSDTNAPFVDNRPVAIAQRKLQALADNSQQVQQAAQLRAMAANRLARRQAPVQRKSNNTGLPDQLKSGIENLSGYSMDDVKVHYNSDKPAQLHAHAYAQGTDIHIAPGQERHLPHEAWHVVQQKQGRVRPTMQMKGKININDDAGLEREADVMGGKAANTKSAFKEQLSSAGNVIATAPKQFKGTNLIQGNTVLQRKGANLLTATAMKARAGSNLLFSDEYDSILDEVMAYYDPGQTSNSNYGIQLHRLGMIRTAIQTWVTANGPLAQAVVNRAILGYSKNDKRRLVLRDLIATVAVEEAHVRGQGKVAADAHHLSDRNALNAHIDAGLKSTDTRLRNTCEWIRTTDKTRIYPVTSTGDSYERIHIAPDKDTRTDEAFFPTGLAGSPGDIRRVAVSYAADDLTNQTNVILTAGGKRTGGWQTDGHVAITNVRTKPRKRVLEVLKHEIQHDADKHYGRDSRRPYREAGEAFDATGTQLGAGGLTHPDLHFTPGGQLDWTAYGFSLQPNGLPNITNKTEQQTFDRLRQIIPVARQGMQSAVQKLRAANAERDLERYKTEYRAYSYQEGPDGETYHGLHDATQNETHDTLPFSTRQLRIFEHIYAEYAHTRNGWDNNPTLADGRSFRTAVSSYWKPDTEGFNKLNSVRIDNVYNALDAVGIKAAATQIETRDGVDAAPVDVGNRIADKNHLAVRQLVQQIDKLLVSECEYILNQSLVWPGKLNRHLTGDALNAVNGAMNRKISFDRRVKQDAYKAKMTNFWGT